MNFSSVIKSIFLAMFALVLVFALNLISSQKYMNNSNNFGVKNTVKESLNIGELRVSGVVTFDDDMLIESTVANYIKNNNITGDVDFEIAVNNNTVTVKVIQKSDLLGNAGNIIDIFSYEVRK
ncbi:MAG: hypothetical protein GX758_05135 [Tenericutes bacterium]|nr:hypothetical protein [Mycoplasmatota bacterium]